MVKENLKIPKKLIGCSIPCFKGCDKTITVVRECLRFADYVVLVDDYCPFKSGQIIKKEIKNKNLFFIFNKKNLGVGGATKLGFYKLLDLGCEIIIKVDADGQINPKLIPLIVEPLLKKEADAVKGNRFTSIEQISIMPKTRIIGNLALSFINKLSSGYWELFDPTNGFVAFSSNSLKAIRLDKVDNRYFFESDLLFQSSLANLRYSQIAMKSIYANEKSSLNPFREIFRFSKLHFINFFKRIIYQYFILDFNIGSLEILGFLLGIISSVAYSFYLTFSEILKGQFITPGQANIFTIIFIISFQCILGFFYYDSTQKPLMRQIKKILT